PGGAGHNVHDVPLVTPGLDAFRKTFVDAVDHRDVGIEMDARAVGVLGLEREPLFSLGSIRQPADHWRNSQDSTGGGKHGKHRECLRSEKPVPGAACHGVTLVVLDEKVDGLPVTNLASRLTSPEPRYVHEISFRTSATL